MTFKPKDHYFHKAKDEGFLARSVYKLREIDSKFRLINKGDFIVDLGAAPGSWSQYCAEKVGAHGKVAGFDLTEIKLSLPNAIFFQQDILNCDMPSFLASQGLPAQADAVISDMAPKTTGIKSVDQDRSLVLCEMALMIADQVLKPGGHFVCKIFEGAGSQKFREELRRKFARVESLKPDSTRSRSFEIFLVGLRKK